MVFAIVLRTRSTSSIALAAIPCAPPLLPRHFEPRFLQAGLQVPQCDEVPRTCRAPVGDHRGPPPSGVAQRRDHQRRLTEILVGRVSVDGDEAAKAGGTRRLEAIARVLDDKGTGRIHAQPLEREKVDVGSGLLVGDAVTRQQRIETCRPVRARRLFQDGDHRRLRGCRSHRQLPAPILSLADDPPDAGSHLQCGGGVHLRVDLGLVPVPGGEQRGPALGIDGQVVRADELSGELARHPLLAAGDLQLVAVLLLRPLQRHPHLPEGLVEGGQMTVTLRVGEHTVAVEDDGAHPQALPWLPNSRMWYLAISITAVRCAVKSAGGSYSPVCALMCSYPDFMKAIFRAVEMFTLAQPRPIRSLNCSAVIPVPPWRATGMPVASTMSVTRWLSRWGVAAYTP